MSRLRSSLTCSTVAWSAVSWSAVLACCGFTASGAADIALTDSSVLHFADVREGIAAITRVDDYIRQLSPFDRQARLKTDRVVSEQEFLAFVAQNVMPWQDDEIRRLTMLFEAVREKIGPWKLNLPPVILLVKTSGQEEGGAAYCRGPAIVLSQNMLSGLPDRLKIVLPHELFHVLSSHNPALREALYETIGFKACNEVPLPPGLRDAKITNPDAPVNNHYITCNLNGRDVELMPVLLSKTTRYDSQRGGTMFSYLDFKLMVLATDDDGTRRPAIADGRPTLLDPATVPGYHEQIGRNTKYIIHPEEVLADNFVFLLDGRIDLPSPRVVERMGRVLQNPPPTANAPIR